MLLFEPRREKTGLRESDVELRYDVVKFLNIFSEFPTRDVWRDIYKHKVFTIVGSVLGSDI